jgi:hypothetical protein
MRCTATALPFVHPVYCVNGGGESGALGSSVLLSRKRQLYLATAAHVSVASTGGEEALPAASGSIASVARSDDGVAVSMWAGRER